MSQLRGAFIYTHSGNMVNVIVEECLHGKIKYIATYIRLWGICRPSQAYCSTGL